MPGKRPPPRGAPKEKAVKAPARGPKPGPGVPQAAIDASNAARRAGLGGVARKGASEVMSPRKGSAPERTPPSKWTGDDWADEGDVREQARGAVERGSTKGRPRTVNRDTDRAAPTKNLPADVVKDFEEAAGTKDAPKLQQRFANARRAYERDRFGEARKLLEPLARTLRARPGCASSTG